MKILFVFVAYNCVVRGSNSGFDPHEIHLNESHDGIVQLQYRVPAKTKFELNIVQEDGNIKDCSCSLPLKTEINPCTPPGNGRDGMYVCNQRTCTVTIDNIAVSMSFTYNCTVEANKKRKLEIKLIVLGSSVNNELLSTIPGQKFLKPQIIPAAEGDLFVARYFVEKDLEIRRFECEGKTLKGYNYTKEIFTAITHKKDAEVSISKLSPAMAGKIVCKGSTTYPNLLEFHQDFNIREVKAKPLIVPLSIKEGSSFKNSCRSNGNIAQDITLCKWNKHLIGGGIETIDGIKKNDECYININSIDKNTTELECSIEVFGVKETPVKYTITMLNETDSKFPVLPVGIGAGVVVLLLVVGGTTYTILKKNASNNLGIAAQSAKTLDSNGPRNPERERYSQGPQRSTRNDDVNITVPVVVAPLPGRKKKKEEKKPVVVEIDDGEGEYFVIGPHGTVRETNNSQPDHTSSLPKIAPPPIPTVNQKKVHASTLEHKRKKPPPPDKPRSETMQSGWPADKKEKPKMKIPVNSNFLGELNQKLSKPPTVLQPRQQPMDDNDNTSYESIEPMDLADREIKEPLIKSIGRKPPTPNPKPKDIKVAIDRNPETLAKKTETERPLLKSIPKRPENDGPSKPFGNPVLSGKPPLPGKPVSGVNPLSPTIPVSSELPSSPRKPVSIGKPALAGKPIVSGKPIPDLPTDVAKGTWRRKEETDRKFSNESTSKSAVPVKGLRMQALESPPLSVRTPMPLPSNPEEDVISQKSAESVSSDEGYLRPRVHTKPAPTTETPELSSDEEWEQYDDIDHPTVYGNLPGSIPGVARPQSEHIYQDPDTVVKPGYKGQSSALFGRNGAGLAQSGAGLAQSGAGLGKSGKGPMPPMKGMKNKPLPPPPQQPGHLYGNMEDLQPRGNPYRKGKY